jgi:hypothetical protein
MKKVVFGIERCCSYNCEVRPSFDEILDILKQMKFRILQGVRDQKVFEFVSQIELWEERQAASIEGTNAKGMGNSA